MAVSRERFSSISELQLPGVFTKERPFETIGMTQRTRQETSHDTDQSTSEMKLYDITVDEDSGVQKKEQCHGLIWSQPEELNDLAKKLVPHQMALERVQEKMRFFLEERAREFVEQQSVQVMSPQEYQLVMEAFFRNIKWIKLNQLFCMSFFHEICLRRIQNISSKDLEPLREGILKAEGIIQNFQEILLGETKVDDYDNLNHLLSKSKENVKQLLEDSVFQLSSEDEIRYTATECRISFALGLEIDFLDQLKLSTDDITFHWSVQDWILNFLSNIYEEIDDEGLKKNLSKELLIKLGFRDDSQAIQTILSRSVFMSNHVEPIELVKRFITDELRYNPILSQELPYGFPFLDKPHMHYKVKSSNKIIEVINVGRAGRNPDNANSARQYVSQHLYKLSDTHCVTLFHGTDHFSALHIIRRGLDINLGHSKRDFSDGVGFYLTNDYDHSQMWSFSLTRKPAVLVFKVPKSLLAESSCLDLSGEENKTDWQQIVSECRSGRRSKKLRSRLRTYDIITGPISKPSDDMNRLFEQRQDSNQVCIISEDCAEEIRNFLHTVIFYESPEN